MSKILIKKWNGGISMNNNSEYKKLDMNKLFSKKSTIISTKESLKDVVPIEWNNEVLSGKKKVIISKG